MNYIQENTSKVRFYTSMNDVARWLEIDLEDYDWHISDIEGAWPELDDPSWVRGEALSSKLQEYDYQFVWSVISAFPKNTEPFTTDEPFADGNQGFWQGEPEKQLKNSLFEIVCWDSSATLFIGLSDVLGNKLVANAPGVKDLNKENAQRQC
ncbi:hypothetical protein ACODM8_18775 [Vibrio ostreicida]|uniref:DUF2750 domain-containing protein n=1 Tax=Vibrio ostreicida TaxID=526588 RepID=A0ABT8BZK1_9VIBR|nr:hypothetical protein [Vibrio ostreicida]MDN3612585.1 hypothetical protein [Vibrio ostreicida]NPD09205.1 hypothetical protein [Vibrio ostreicida]